MVLLVLGTLAMMALGQHDEIVTTGITTAVVMVAAGLSQQAAWYQPLFRLVDTLVGVLFRELARQVLHPLASVLESDEDGRGENGNWI